MTFAFGHLIGAWLFGHFLQSVTKRRWTNWEWAWLLFGGLLPDIDFVIAWLGLGAHRTYSHSILFMIACFFGAIAVGSYLNLVWKGLFRNKTLSGTGIALAAGVFNHLILDMVFGPPGITVLWPWMQGFWFFGMKPFAIGGLFSGGKAKILFSYKFALVEMFLAIVWLMWLFVSGRVDFTRKKVLKEYFKPKQ